MKEDFLHYIWKYKLFNSTSLQTEAGEELVVIHSGQHNSNGGPDFLNARLRMNGTLWAGHVEIHIKGSDWHKHSHTDDPHYKNVILHVVYEDDEPIYLFQPGDLSVLKLKHLIDMRQLQTYEAWMLTTSWIPCKSQIKEVNPTLITSWKDALILERLQEKMGPVLRILEETAGNWPEVFYRVLSRNFGFKVNAEAFEMLANSLPLSILRRHRSDPFQVEALLFGQAGMIHEDLNDEHGKALWKEYKYLRRKYGLMPIPDSAWNYARMRPANFPSMRLAQLCVLLGKEDRIFSFVLDTNDVHSLKEWLDVEAGEFWCSHYRFLRSGEKKTRSGSESLHSSRLGKAAVENIIINTVVPVLVAYGQTRSEEKFIEKAIQLLDICPPEKNVIMDKWQSLGLKSASAADSQALLQLFNAYCTKKKCLNCRIGVSLIKTASP